MVGQVGITGLPKAGEFVTDEFHIFYHFNKENLIIIVQCFFKTFFTIECFSFQNQDSIASFSSEIFKTSYIHCVVFICTFLSNHFLSGQ